MAVTSPNQWTLASLAGGDYEIVTGPTSGNWLVAIVAWSVTNGSSQTVTVADPSVNMWQLLFSTTTAATASKTTAGNAAFGMTQVQNVQIWACPSVAYAGWSLLDVYTAITNILGGDTTITYTPAGDIGSVAINIFELAGMGNGSLTVDSVTLGTASAATSFSISAPAPAADVVMVAAANTDTNSATQTFTAAGWTTLTQVSQNKVIASGAGYFNPDLRLTAAWRETTAAQTATWTSSAACNWAGVVAAFRQTGVAPVQLNSNYPAPQFLVGLGVQAGTPPPAVRWTDLTNRLLDWNHQRGLPYELGTAQALPTDLQIRNDDGAFTPRPGGTATANAAGTTTTLVCASTAVSGVNVSDYFQLKNSGGVLKEFTVFRVTGVSTVGATTTITFTVAAERAQDPPGGAGGGALVATASGDIYGAVPIDLGIPYRKVMTWQGRPQIVASGLLAECPQMWIDNHWGEVPSVAYDPLMQVAKVPLDSNLRMEIFNNGPTHYWPQDDPQSSPVSANIGSQATVLVPTNSKFGIGAGSTAYAVQQVITGDNGTAWQVTGMTSAQINAGQGAALVGVGNDFPSVANGVTIFGVLFVPTADANAYTGSTQDPTVMIVRSANPGGGSATLLKLQIIRSTQKAAVTVWDKVTKVPTQTTSATSFGVGTVEYTWALSFNQSNFYLYINGNFATSGTCNLGASFNVIDIGGEADGYVTGHFFGGIHSHVAVFPFMLSDGLHYQMTIATQSRYRGLTHGVARRGIVSAGYLGPRVLTPSIVTFELLEQESGNIVDLLGKCGDYEDGLFFADASGCLQFRSDQAAALQVPRATLGENESGGELPYLPQWGSKMQGYDITYLYTAAKVSNTRMIPATGQTTTSNIIARAPGQYPKYGVPTLTRSTSLFNDWQAWNLAWWLLNQYQAPKLRLEKLVFDAVKNPNLWAFLLDVEVGDMVTVNRRPIGAPLITATCRVVHIEVRAEPPEVYEVTLTMAAARLPVYVCNDPTRGIVGTNGLGM